MNTENNIAVLSKDLQRLKLDISDLIEGIGNRSDVYDGIRVIMKTNKLKNSFYVYVSGHQAVDFNFYGDEEKIFEFIKSKIK